MRSDLVFEATSPVRNRYMLCQLVSKATRKFHRPNTRIQDTMNQVLDQFGEAERAERITVNSEKLGQADRQAA